MKLTKYKTKIETSEECPVCRSPEMTIVHGWAELTNYVHQENCPECGEHWPIVCYDCEHCNQASQHTD